MLLLLLLLSMLMLLLVFGPGAALSSVALALVSADVILEMSV